MAQIRSVRLSRFSQKFKIQNSTVISNDTRCDDKNVYVFRSFSSPYFEIFYFVSFLLYARPLILTVKKLQLTPTFCVCCDTHILVGVYIPYKRSLFDCHSLDQLRYKYHRSHRAHTALVFSFCRLVLG